ncbi:MAG: RNA polymerase sigma factor [Pseudoalteromonas prydzensis]|uniref:RNA polymerase sigma factor n=1 Tax=Pseudoalteromonas prydzensis TaxID=182141 RepID=UPI003F978D75
MISQTKPSLSLASKQSQSHRPLVKCFIANQDALKSFFCRAVGEQADADDLFQKLLMKALKIECSAHIDNPLAYGYRMAQHLVIDHHREQNKSPESLEHEPESNALSLENLLEHEQRLRLYQQVLTQMSALRRDVFIRRRLHGESRQQIAQSLGLSEEAVKKHISRAMDMLKDAISTFIVD